jgi:hypothetical protein
LWLFTAALVALLASLYFSRRYLSWAILWIPAPFYVLCIAWGSVPIYHPEWWPFSYYNVRYGLQLLPAIAVFAALACEFAANFLRPGYVIGVASLLIVASYFSAWQAPICLREARTNGVERMALEQALAEKLKSLPQRATVLMYCSAHAAALQMVGVPLKRRLCENDHPGWEDALARPAESADYLVAFAGDPVAGAVHEHPQGLEAVAIIGTPSQPKALIYRSTHR